MIEQQEGRATAAIVAKPQLLIIAMKDIVMQTEHIKIIGMNCGGCSSKVTRALQAISGVDDVKVSLPAGEAIVKYDEHITSTDELRSVIEGAGYGVDVANVAHKQPTKSGCCS